MNKLYIFLCLLTALAFIASCTSTQQIPHEDAGTAPYRSLTLIEAHRPVEPVSEVQKSVTSPKTAPVQEESREADSPSKPILAPASSHALIASSTTSPATTAPYANDSQTQSQLQSQVSTGTDVLKLNLGGGTVQTKILISIYQSIEELKTTLESTLELLEEEDRNRNHVVLSQISSIARQPIMQTNTVAREQNGQTTRLDDFPRDESLTFREDILEEARSDYPPDDGEPREPAIAFDDYPNELLPVFISPDYHVILDEFVLIQWEERIRAGQFRSEDLPKWIIQGLEQLTHTDRDDPLRLERLMPLYRHMESSAYLQNVNVKLMEPYQVVIIMRRFVNDMKQSQGVLAQS